LATEFSGYFIEVEVAPEQFGEGRGVQGLALLGRAVTLVLAGRLLLAVLLSEGQRREHAVVLSGTE